jgi:ketosteroid isomerase-like protein
MDPKTVVIRYVEAARDGMSAVIRDSFAEDATWEYPGDLPLSGTYRGIDAIVTEFLGGAAALMAPGVVLELTNVVAEGDQVVAEWTSRATARNGAAYRNRNAGIFTVRDGKIVSVREYTDTQHVAQVLLPADL